MTTLHGTTTAVVAAVALVLGGCGGDDGTPVDAAIDAPAVTAADFAGLWLMTELIVDDGGSPLTLRRDGVTQALRGDAQFTATATLTGELRVRQVALAQGLPASEIMTTTSAVAIEPDRWILTEPGGGVLVFLAARTGDHLVLTHDPSDPRDTATDPPIAVTVDRVAPWSTTMVGAWDLVSITVGGDTYLAGACTPIGAGAWGTIAMAIDIDDRLMFTRIMTTRRYSDAGCTSATGTTSSTQLGLAEEESGLRARIWGVEGDTREYQAFDLATAGGDLTLTRTACLPQPACLDTAPTQVVVRRRP